MVSSSALTAFSNREYMMMAETPASCSHSVSSILRDRGEAEGTKGFFSRRPRQLLVRSMSRSDVDLRFIFLN